MCKLCSLLLLGVIATFAASSAARARGGTYHHSDFVPLSSIEKAKPPNTATRHYLRNPSLRFLPVPEQGVKTKPKAQ
jgi:hypothetical protein